MSTFEKTFVDGDVIIREGDSGNTFLQLLEGNVDVFKNYGQADEVQVAVIEPGQYFGEMAVIETYPRSSTVVATGDVKVVEIPAEALNDYFTQNPDKILAIMENKLQRQVSRLLRSDGSAVHLPYIKEFQTRASERRRAPCCRKTCSEFRRR